MVSKSLMTDIVSAIIYALVVVGLIVFTSQIFADEANKNHKSGGDTYITEVNQITEVKYETQYETQDYGNALNALSAISAVPSLSLPGGGTAIGAGFSGYDGNGGALVVEHNHGVMTSRFGVGHSGGEEVFQYGIIGRWR